MHTKILICKQCGKNFKIKTSFGTRSNPDLPVKDSMTAVNNYSAKIQKEVDSFLKEMASRECVEFNLSEEIAC